MDRKFYLFCFESTFSCMLTLSSRSSYTSSYGISRAASFNHFLELSHIVPIVRLKNDLNEV